MNFLRCVFWSNHIHDLVPAREHSISWEVDFDGVLSFHHISLREECATVVGGDAEGGGIGLGVEGLDNSHDHN